MSGWYNTRYSLPQDRRVGDNENEQNVDRDVLLLGPRGGYFIGRPTWQTTVNNPYYREKFTGQLQPAVYWRELPKPPDKKDGNKKRIRKNVSVRKLTLLYGPDEECICEYCARYGGEKRKICAMNRLHADTPDSCLDFSPLADE